MTLRVLHVSDSYLGVAPYRSPVRSEELWHGITTAVRRATELECQVLLHTGALISDFGRASSSVSRLRGVFDEAMRNGVQVVVLQDGADLTPLDVDVLVPGGGPVSVPGGVVALEPSDLEGAGGVRILARRACVRGMPATDRSLGALDPEWLVAVQADYVALGGAAFVQPVQPNAWYPGQTARVGLRDTGRAGGLLLELERAPDRVDPVSGAAVRRLTRVSWADRAHRTGVVAARGLTSGQLARILEHRVRELVTHRSSGDAPTLEPVLSLFVHEPESSLEDLATSGRWMEVLRGGCAYAQVRWGSHREFVQGVVPAG